MNKTSAGNNIALNYNSVDPNQHFVTAEKFHAEGDSGKALSFLSLGLVLLPEKKNQYYSLYFSLLDSWCHDLEKSEQFENVLKILEVAKDIFTDSLDLNYLLARSLFRCGKFREAWQYSLKAASLNTEDPCIKILKDNLTNALVDRWHIPMLNDTVRNQCFKRAITNCISKGYIDVLDIGAGTCILSIYAKQAGCRSATACEMNSFMCEVAAEVLQNNNQNTVDLLNVHSKDLVPGKNLKRKVSLLITETFDAGLFGEHVLETLKHAWENILVLSANETDGTQVQLLPSSADLYISIIECDYFAKQTKLVTKNKLFENYIIQVEQNEPYFSEKLYQVKGGFKMLTDWVKIDNVNFNSIEDINSHLFGEEKKVSIPCICEGRPDAIAVSFALHLNEDEIDTFPTHNGCWENALFPIDYPNVKINDIIKVKYRCGDPISLSLQDSLFQGIEKIQLNTEVLMLLNNEFFVSFYTNASTTILQQKKAKQRIIVCDLCPFPVAGIHATRTQKNTILYVINKSVKDLLTCLGIPCFVIEELNSKIDIIFVWPLRSDGSLAEEITHDLLKLFIPLLNEDGNIFPNYMQLNCIAIESKELLKMVQVTKDCTSDVDLQCFNLFKTSTQLDVTLSNLTHKKLTSTIIPVKLNLSTGQAEPVFQSSSSNLQFTIHNTNVLNAVEDLSNVPNNRKYLCFGGPLLEVEQNVKFEETGSITGFAYWFSLHGQIDKKDVLGHTSELTSDHFDINKLGLNNYDSSCVTNQCILVNELEQNVSVNDTQLFKVIWRDGNFNIKVV